MQLKDKDHTYRKKIDMQLLTIKNGPEGKIGAIVEGTSLLNSQKNFPVSERPEYSITRI